MESKSYLRYLQRSALNLAAAAGLLWCSFAAHAAGFPTKPVRFIVPFPPGSAIDTAARYFGAKFTSLTGQPTIIENKAGGNGFIAVQNVLSSPCRWLHGLYWQQFHASRECGRISAAAIQPANRLGTAVSDDPCTNRLVGTEQFA